MLIFFEPSASIHIVGFEPSSHLINLGVQIRRSNGATPIILE